MSKEARARAAKAVGQVKLAALKSSHCEAGRVVDWRKAGISS